MFDADFVAKHLGSLDFSRRVSVYRASQFNQPARWVVRVTGGPTRIHNFSQVRLDMAIAIESAAITGDIYSTPDLVEAVAIAQEYASEYI